MKRIRVILGVIFFLNMSFLSTLSAMEPDEESLQDPKFVAEYDCLTEHFLIKKYFEKEAWMQAMKAIENLETKGYADQFLTIAKAKVFTKLGVYEKALDNFQKALSESYKCRLTGFKIKFAQYPDLAKQAILWHYISQVYELMGNQNQATSAKAKAEELLTKSLGLSSEEEIRNKKNTKAMIIRVFSVFTLFQKPLIP